MLFISRCLRLAKFAAVFYIVVAVLYTTHYLLLAPVTAGVAALKGVLSPGHRQSWIYVLQGFLPSWFLNASDMSREEAYKPVMLWQRSSILLNGSLQVADPVPIDEDLFLSKAFLNSMRPSQIVPYYYRATGNSSKDDITITTLITSNRFAAFSRLVDRYQGPISVTVHIKNTTPRMVNDLLASLDKLYTSSDKMKRQVDMHLVIDPFDRQFNMWRNIARFFARTEFVMMLDIDFYICTDFRRSILENKHLLEQLREGNSAYVIPAFEYSEYREGMDPSAFPRSKRSLLSLVKAKKMRMFHSSWAPGHNSTEYDRYYASPPKGIYKVTRYQSAYEPYIIFKKEGPPWCDERFIGYGGNKAACLYEMYLSGVSLYVLADHFIVHQNHVYEERARKHEVRTAL
ncbi:hypothetical protein AX16_004035 [Volvariella volvacea WC 439]|nr:hypothetical protein AX16_004035 [Volvariella volvacea WC 439]